MLHVYIFTFNPLAKHFAPGTLNWFQLMLSSVILLFSAEKKKPTHIHVEQIHHSLIDVSRPCKHI